MIDLVNVKEAAVILKCSEPTVRRMEYDGKINRVPNISGVRFRRKDVEKLAGGDSGTNLNIAAVLAENARLKKEIESLRKILTEIYATASNAVVRRYEAQ